MSIDSLSQPVWKLGVEAAELADLVRQEGDAHVRLGHLLKAKTLL